MLDEDILNDFFSIPHSQLSTLELDIAVLNQFEIQTLMGGGTSYFDSYVGDNIDRLVESASRHSFTELVGWINRISDICPELVSVDRDTRAEGLFKLESEAEHDEIYELGCKLAQEGALLCARLIKENKPELEAAYLARH